MLILTMAAIAFGIPSIIMILIMLFGDRTN